MPRHLHFLSKVGSNITNSHVLYTAIRANFQMTFGKLEGLRVVEGSEVGYYWEVVLEHVLLLSGRHRLPLLIIIISLTVVGVSQLLKTMSIRVDNRGHFMTSSSLSFPHGR